MYLFEGLREQAGVYLPPEAVDKLQQAYLVARDAHASQMRSSGEPYITHPVAVSQILAGMRLDLETLMAALLHDVIEDTALTRQDLADKFGDSVADLVEGVSKLDKLKFNSKEEAQAENFRKMFMAMVQDIRVILIKLADRTHNMRTLGSLRPDKRRRIARETLEIFAPIAHRLGIHNIKNELESLGFEALHPMRFRALQTGVKRAAGNRKELSDNIQQALEERLSKMGIQARVLGREKHLWSIYNKMRRKEVSFNDVMDIYAYRVVVDSLDTCYRVLGLVHNLFKPRPNRFKDYIAIPKTNGYQSLHTSLFGPHGVPVEIQIRTEDMDQMADKGVAAHWAYKTGTTIGAAGQDSGTTAQARARRWMRSLMELQQSTGSSFEFIENVKTDLFPKEIYVFTPDGAILELPHGATPVDFAYAVHTDVGNTCVGSRVDRLAYPLSAPLTSGQTVEIITAAGARPNAAWLNFVVTSKARTKIRHVLKDFRLEESVALGRRLLNHALGDIKLDDISEERIQNVVEISKQDSFDHVLADIGLGRTMSLAVARMLRSEEDQVSQEMPGGMPIRGTEGMLVHFSRCCHPIPGDPIVAHISGGKGLSIHVESCANIRGYQNKLDRYFPAQWDNTENEEFFVKLRVDLLNHSGVLAALTRAIAEQNSDIHNISLDERDARIFTIDLVITTKGRVHLAHVMRKLKAIPDVVKVVRHRN